MPNVPRMDISTRRGYRSAPYQYPSMHPYEKKICVVTGSRAEYGYLCWLMKLLQK